MSGTGPAPPAITDSAQVARTVLGELERAIVGKRSTLELVLSALLADGHVLLEDFPGLAKTLIARSIAQVTGLSFTRVQFTPDLVPADLTGSAIYDPGRREFEFHAGPVFTNLLLGDEINRAPPKTQAALLECMEERQVTIDGVTRALARPFLVIATQNPIEYEGTYPLPEAQLDRFLVRVGVGYPTEADELEILARRIDRRHDDVRLRQVIDQSGVRALQDAVESVEVHDSVARYIVSIVAATRQSRRVVVGASPRGTIALMKCARAHALVQGRTFVTPDDVKLLTEPVLAHRIVLRPELWVQSFRPEQVVQECLQAVPTPAPLEQT
jgi:MoxR-like ATPase